MFKLLQNAAIILLKAINLICETYENFIQSIHILKIISITDMQKQISSKLSFVHIGDLEVEYVVNKNMVFHYNYGLFIQNINLYS